MTDVLTDTPVLRVEHLVKHFPIRGEGVLNRNAGEVKAVFQPNSSTGGPGDKLHPNRAGYAAMANAIDLKAITGR